jgi:hypothetical protein
MIPLEFAICSLEFAIYHPEHSEDPCLGVV